jgi:four helix bundle protein
MSTARTFRDLIVWRKGMEAAMLVFAASKAFPIEERCSLTDHIRRSSRSVPAKIAVAWRKRRHPAALVSKLSDAEAEAVETQTHIEIARRCSYLSVNDATSLDNLYDEILTMIESMANEPEQWSRQ